MNHSGKWTATEFDYTNSNFDGIYMYLHGECHFLLTFTCAVFCGGLLVCVFTLLVLMWFYLFDWLLNVSSSPLTRLARGILTPQTITTQRCGNIEARHPNPRPLYLFALVVSFVFSLHLPRSVSFDILQSMAMKHRK